MTIDGVDLSTLYPTTKLLFLDYELASPSYNRYITTTDNDYKIVNRRVTIGITNIKVRLVMFDTKENCYIMASKIASLCGDALINFGGDLTYRVQISMDGTFENLAYNTYMYTLQLQVLDKLGPEVTVTTADDAVVLTNDGTYVTPIRIVMTPASTTSIGISGFGVHTIDNPLTITNITIGQNIILDGAGQVLEVVGGIEENKFSDTNLAEFPTIPVGTTTLLFTPTGLPKVITYRPRYV